MRCCWSISLTPCLTFHPRAVRGVHLLNPFVAKEYAEGKVSVLDVKARDDPGRLFLLEMQRYLPPGLTRRLLYYWASGHVSQFTEGQRYELLMPTYSICWFEGVLFQDAAYHHKFRVVDVEHGVLLCPDLELHVIELGKFALAVEAIKTPLERWCYFFKHGATLDLASLPATLDVPPIRKAMEILMKVSQDEREREHYLERVRAQRDAANILEEARMARQEGFAQGREEGMEKGREEGMEKGIEKGKAIGRIQLLQQLLQQPETSSDELNRLPEQDLLRVEEALKQQLATRKQANGTPPTDKT